MRQRTTQVRPAPEVPGTVEAGQVGMDPRCILGVAQEGRGADLAARLALLEAQPEGCLDLAWHAHEVESQALRPCLALYPRPDQADGVQIRP